MAELEQERIMTEQEQIEKWRESFECGYSGEKDCFVRHPAFKDCYWFEKVQLHWEGFLMAKRAQKPVELPNPLCFTSSPSGHGEFAYVELEPLIERLENAGIEWISENPYPVKGE